MKRHCSINGEPLTLLELVPKEEVRLRKLKLYRVILLYES